MQIWKWNLYLTEIWLSKKEIWFAVQYQNFMPHICANGFLFCFLFCFRFVLFCFCFVFCFVLFCFVLFFVLFLFLFLFLFCFVFFFCLDFKFNQAFVDEIWFCFTILTQSSHTHKNPTQCWKKNINFFCTINLIYQHWHEKNLLFLFGSREPLKYVTFEHDFFYFDIATTFICWILHLLLT